MACLFTQNGSQIFLMVYRCICPGASCYFHDLYSITLPTVYTSFHLGLCTLLPARFGDKIFTFFFFFYRLHLSFQMSCY